MKYTHPPYPIDEEFFDDVFFQELDYWFAADMACCDECYQGFLKVWPAANSAGSTEFESNQIQLDLFYEGSRINAHYTKEQFERLAQELECPRCCATLGYTLYPYELPFDVPKDFEGDIEAISTIANETPFLILKNDLAQKVLHSIAAVAESTCATDLPSNLFRARGMTGLKEIAVDQFNFADPAFVGEGRYNHAGQSVLYLGDSKETCFHELRRAKCAVAEIALEGAVKVFDLATPYDSHEEQSDFLNALVFSSLLSTPQDGTGYKKPAYVFSRFVADCARSAGFDAIRYPSTQASARSHNLAILNVDFAIGNRSRFISLCYFDGSASKNIEL